MEDLAAIQYNCILDFGGILKLMILLLEEWKMVSLTSIYFIFTFQFVILLHICIQILTYIYQLLYFASSHQGKAM